MYIVLLCVTLMARPILAGEQRYQFFRARNFTDVGTVVSCTRLTAKRLFNAERRIDVIYSGPAEDFEDAILRAFSSDRPMLIADRVIRIKDARIPSYVVVEHGRFANSRRTFLLGPLDLRTPQYLFVTKAKKEQVHLFARDLLNAGYRDAAFLAFDAETIGTIIRANATGNEITLRSVGSCAKLANDVDQIPPFAADSRRFCPLGGCTMKYGIVTDATVSFWRKEDTLKLKPSKGCLKNDRPKVTTLAMKLMALSRIVPKKELIHSDNESLKAVGALIMEDFGGYYNLSIDSSAGINVPWPEAFRKLVNREIDVAAGPKPEDPCILNNVEVICWYMYRDMVLASLVHVKTIQNDILKMLMPFHYLVWLSVFVVFFLYALLLIILQKLSGMGLIKERVRFAYVCAISLAQGVAFPRNFGLRLVMLLWMVFSLYLSITYNSTFTSSLAQVETEDLLENLEQVRDSGRPLGGPGVVRSYFNSSDDRFIRDLYERYKVIGPEEALDSIFTGNGIAVLQHFTVDRMNWDYRTNRSLRLYTLQRPVFRFPVFFFARRGYIYRRPLRRLVTKYRETGMIYKLDRAMVIEEDKQIALNQASDEILTMKHLRPIFEIFFVCQGIGCLILLLELLVSHLSRTL